MQITGTLGSVDTLIELCGTPTVTTISVAPAPMLGRHINLQVIQLGQPFLQRRQLDKSDLHWTGPGPNPERTWRSAPSAHTGAPKFVPFGERVGRQLDETLLHLSQLDQQLIQALVVIARHAPLPSIVPSATLTGNGS